MLEDLSSLSSKQDARERWPGDHVVNRGGATPGQQDSTDTRRKAVQQQGYLPSARREAGTVPWVTSGRQEGFQSRK